MSFRQGMKDMKKRGNKEGSIFQTKSGAWVAQIHLGYKDNGQPRYKQIQRKTKKEALEALEQIKREIATDTFIDRTNLLFNDWVKEYLHTYSKIRIRQTTFDKYESFARNHIYPAFVGFKLQDVTTNMIQRFISSKAESKSSTTVRELRLIISQSLQQAVKEKFIRENPALYTTLPRIEEQEVQPLSEVELKKLLSAAKEHRLYYALMLIVSTGMRRGELLGLQWNDLNFETNTIRVVRSFVKTTVGDIIQETKTRASKRVVNIPEHIMQLLKTAYEERNMNNPWLVPVTYQRTNQEYLPISPRNFSRVYKTWCEKAGIKNLRIHSLRHTYASLALSMNVHMKVVQAQLGHADIKMTMNRYSHLMTSIQQEAAEKMNLKLSTILADDSNIQLTSEEILLN